MIQSKYCIRNCMRGEFPADILEYYGVYNTLINITTYMTNEIQNLWFDVTTGNNLIFISLVNLFYLCCQVIGLHVTWDVLIKISRFLGVINAQCLVQLTACCAVYVVLLPTVFEK